MAKNSKISLILTRTEHSKFHVERQQRGRPVTLCGWSPPLWISIEVAIEGDVERSEICSHCLKIAAKPKRW
jgi:hypothetical protein